MVRNNFSLSANRPRKRGRRWLGIFALISLLLGIGCLLEGTHISLKAYAAQFLLQRAWQKSQDQGTHVKPWPWFDSFPVGRLQVERLGVDMIVLEGDSGAILAFGPGRNGSSSPLISNNGNCIISGHRDTSFHFIGELEKGDTIMLEGLDGRTKRFQVEKTDILSSDELYLPTTGDLLTLVTCYPLDGIVPGTEKRYVVTAQGIKE